MGLEGPRRAVAVVTGGRSEFGLLEGTIRRLAAGTTLSPRAIVAGMHLDRDLGETWREVEARFPLAGRVPMSPPEDTPRGMALAVAEGIRGFAGLFRELEPALLLVLGDRIEPFAAALAAAYTGTPIAHIHGGDVSGSALDDLHRDLISRAARLHLPVTARSAARLRAMAVQGEIEIVGAPGLDAILAEPPRPRAEVLAGLSIPADGPVLVVVYHPVPAGAVPDGDAAGAEAGEALAAAVEEAERCRGSVAVLYPNNDAGHRAVIARIEGLRGHPRVRIFPSLPRSEFIGLLRAADLLLGNSSSGVIESVSLGIPAVNIGLRQAGRERNANVVDAPPRRAAVRRAIERARTDPVVREAVNSRRNLYGDGRAAERIAQALERFVERGGSK